MSNLILDNKMHNSWNYLNDLSIDEQNAICNTLKSNIGDDVKYESILKAISDLGITNQSYSDFLNNILKSLDATPNNTKLSLDIYVLAQLVKYVLNNNKELKEKFCEQENFISVSSFSSEFDSKLKLSRIFAMRMPAYALLLSGAVDVKMLSKFVGGSIADTFLAGGITSSITAIIASSITGGLVGGGVLGLAGMLAGPLAIAAVGLFCGMKGINSLLADDFLENLKKYCPLYMVLIQLHASHCQKFRSIEEAKTFILETLSSLKQDSYLNAYIKYVKLSYLQLAFLDFLLEEGKDVLDLPNNVLWKESLKSQLRCKITDYVPIHILRNLLNIPNMDRKQVVYELIDFLYGMSYNKFEVSTYNSINEFLKRIKGNQKCLTTYFCFPFSKITPSVVFYVNKNNICKRFLTEIYLSIHGYNLNEYICDGVCKSNFNYIISSRDRETKFSNFLSKDGLFIDFTWFKGRKASNLMPNQSELMPNQSPSNYNAEKIKQLEQRISVLERQLEDKMIFCHRFHHDLGNVFASLVLPLESKNDNPSKEITNEAVKQSMKDVRLFRELWDRLVKGEEYGEATAVPIEELMDVLCDEIKKKRNLIMNNKIGNVCVNMSKSDFCNVIHNLIQNFDRHAFPSNFSQHDSTVTINSEIIDNELRLYVGNNGQPYMGDINKFFDYKLDTKKGLGVSSMRECMRHYEGNLEVSLETDNTITYIFIFKII